MIITKIEKQKHDQQRYSVFIDNIFAFGLDGVDILYYKLKEGGELSDEEYNRIIDENIFIKARDAAVVYLAYRSRSRKEVYDKLFEKEYGEDVIERVLEQMEKYKYIDDEKFCQMYISDKIRLNGYGSVRIAYELQMKGIDGEIIERCLLESGFDESEEAYNALRKKYKNSTIISDDEYNIDINEFRKAKKKAVDFLVRKGYPYEIADKAFKRFINQ